MVRHLRRTGRLFLVAVILALAAGCGGDSRRLADGQWYGKLVGVHVAHRSLTFAPRVGSSPRAGSAEALAPTTGRPPTSGSSPTWPCLATFRTFRPDGSSPCETASLSRCKRAPASGHRAGVTGGRSPASGVAALKRSSANDYGNSPTLYRSATDGVHSPRRAEDRCAADRAWIRSEAANNRLA